MDGTRDVSNIRDISNIEELERFVLRFMCSGNFDDSSMAEARRTLAGYRWRDEEHRVVFEALTRVRNADLVPLREQIAQHATRMGFPDVEWERYLQPSETLTRPIDRQELESAVKELLVAPTEHC